MSKTRLDVLLCEKGLSESREKARAAIMSGIVFVDGNRALKPGTMVPEASALEVRGGPTKFVSRGGFKLEKALDFFDVSPAGKICIDCGASTGGFTDCLLKRDAARVYAVDVGYGQLAWSVRSDPRVVTMERTNVRYLTPEQFPEKMRLAVVDVSFISLSLILPAVRPLLTADGELICLVKPQFEAGREKVGKKGVVRDGATHLEVLCNFMENAEKTGFHIKSLTFSPIKGPEGNIEFLGHLTVGGEDAAVDAPGVVREAHSALDEQ
ncbi:23S rRNA (cytidine1920-2'-O)/16S rRNA (cytidine1409-2'-O)-methyltransferase [Sporobacter termitidis DSM 10068]|uniref:23S rRNA (Cytidine1920-2'-O)/16S rRNA (Cytidine1409-2'-O)-methyltransferase n=1 Tax=Sporobacter termitidis DSM 10068 TaxID=1123282 RepID=A0A1M5Y8I2_9FIRM|nr:TlyA family RNA methyltransferase [Sporobacter termitidis]SHI08124.1 23S rRNA (cytidine1920-2'-O)/16S rRNA (cytidine1409-2'-O)-methyltransferase [Sporobacter termitidis DSM 10068]